MVKLYPDPGLRRAGRIATDALVAAWSVIWLLVGVEVYRLAISLQRLSDGITGAGQRIDGVISAFRMSVPADTPLIGGYFDQLSRSLERSSGTPLITLGGQVHGDIARLAVVISVAVAAPPLLIVTGRHVARRWREMREMGAARAFVAGAIAHDAGPAATALLAYRAVSRLSFTQLMRVTQDPVADLIEGRHEALAAAHLAQIGLKVRLPGSSGPSAHP